MTAPVRRTGDHYSHQNEDCVFELNDTALSINFLLIQALNTGCQKIWMLATCVVTHKLWHICCNKWIGTNWKRAFHLSRVSRPVCTWIKFSLPSKVLSWPAVKFNPMLVSLVMKFPRTRLTKSENRIVKGMGKTISKVRWGIITDQLSNLHWVLGVLGVSFTGGVNLWIIWYFQDYFLRLSWYHFNSIWFLGLQSILVMIMYPINVIRYISI